MSSHVKLSSWTHTKAHRLRVRPFSTPGCKSHTCNRPETLSHARSVPCHVCPHSAPESPRSIPLDKEDGGCQGRVGTHSRAWPPGARRPESRPGLHGMVCDHLPEVPVHRGVQGAQAARGDPEEKAIASVPRGMRREWGQALTQHTCPRTLPSAKERGSPRALPEEHLSFPSFRALAAVSSQSFTLSAPIVPLTRLGCYLLQETSPDPSSNLGHGSLSPSVLKAAVLFKELSAWKPLSPTRPVSSEELTGYESSPLCPVLSQMFDKIIRQQTSELSRGVCRGRAEKGLAQGHTQHLRTTEMQWRIQGTRIRQAWDQIPALPRTS